MWFGTSDGLNRYDGYEFIIYKNDPSDSFSLPDNFILSLEQSAPDVIWIGTRFGGLVRFNLNDYKCYRQKDFIIGKLPDISITALYEAGDYLWIGTEKGLRTMNPKTGFVQTPRHSLVNRENILFIWMDSFQVLWVGTKSGLFKAEASLTLPPEEIEFEYIPLKSQSVFSAFEDEYHDVWFGVYGGLVHYDRQADSYTNQAKQGSTTQCRGLTEISDREFLAITLGDGMFYTVPAKDARGHLQFDTVEPVAYEALPGGKNVSCALRTDDGHLWVGTDGGGVGKLFLGSLNQDGRFQHLPPDSLTAEGLTYHDVGAITRSRDGSLWIGLWGGGINQIQVEPKDECASGFKRSKVHNQKHGLPNENVISLLELESGDLLIGSDGFGLFYYERAGKTYQVFTADNSLLTGDYINVLENLNSEVVLIGTSGGLNVFNTTTRQVSRLPLGEEGDEPVTSGFGDGTVVWIGTRKGNVYTVEQSLGIKKAVQDVPRPVLSIYRERNLFWLGTEGAGLVACNSETGTMEEFGTYQGLPNTVVYGVLPDQAGNIWFSTNNGLCRMNKQTRKLATFSKKDGIQENEFNRRAFFKDNEGRMYFGGINGVTIFNPECIRANTYKPPVVLTSVHVLNKDRVPAPVIVLKPDDKMIRLSFAALNFNQTEKNQYAFRLEGFHPDWITTNSKNRSVTFANLEPGNYVFHVKASNEDGVWNEEGLSVKLVVLSPVWATPYAYVLYVLLLIGVLWAARRNIVNRERLKAKLKLEHLELEKLKELDEFKSKFFANISHEFRTPLTLILGHTTQLRNHQESDSNAVSSIEKNSRTLLELVNQMLDLSRLDAGKLELHPERLEVMEFFARHINTFQSLAKQKGIRFTLKTSNEEYCADFDPLVLEKIVNNLMSNALRYTPSGGSVDCAVAIEKGELVLTVTDSGIGIAGDQLDKIFERFYRASEHTEGTGIGLAVTHELVKLCGGIITVTSEVRKGSVFRVELPLPNLQVIGASSQAHAIHSPEHPVENRFDPDELKPKDQSRPSVLIAEDNAELRKFLKSSLTEYEVLSASKGEEALKLAASHLPDIVVTDWMMPGMSGIELCRKLKSDEATSHIPVIILTARADGSSKVEGLETGADDYLTKPFEMTELKARLRNLINQRALLREKFSSEGLLAYRHVKVSSLDEQFLQRFQSLLQAGLAYPSMSVENLSREMGVSRMQLHRKLTALTGHSPSELIREHRLQRAADLLRQKAGNVSEIAFQVGFDNLPYFTRAFKQRFGVNPSEFNSN